MNLPDSLLLGLVQGITEFLPVSSTAHLRIVPALLGHEDPGAAFTAVLQLGTLAAVIGFFLRDLIAMLRAVFSADPAQRPQARRLAFLIVGTLPVGIAGLLFRHHIEGPLRSLTVIGTALIVVAILMGLADRFFAGERTIDDLTWRDAILIGLAQALALIPGVSRSGITLVAGLALGLRRDAAARFSFLLSVPAIGAAGVFELPKVLHAQGLSAPVLAAGLVTAFVSGYLSIAWLLRFLRTHKTTPFVVYRVALGLLLILGATAGRFH